VQIQIGKLCGRTLKVYQVQNKPNLNSIFKSYLGYRDLEGLHNSLNYFERLQKKLFAMIQQFSPPMFFVTFTFPERLRDFFIKALHTLNALRLNLSNKIEDLQFVHIIKLIQIDPMTCVKYYNHRTFCFHKLVTNDHSLFGYISDFFNH
jgi:hypothetical protein